MAESRWPYTEPHVSVYRWMVDIPGACSLKGISEEDAADLAEAYGGTTYRATITVVTGGPDKGAEVLGPWREAKAHPFADEMPYDPDDDAEGPDPRDLAERPPGTSEVTDGR